MRVRMVLSAAAAALVSCWSASAQAQIDPRAPLSQLISAFQHCGPPQVYQMLSPQLFQLIAQQTGGRGCYPEMAAAGPVTNMVVIDQKNLPLGPVFVVRVTHQVGGQADWFIGINLSTQRVEFLTFQAVTPGIAAPTIEAGPTTPQIVNPGPSPTPGPTPTPAPNPSGEEGCSLYPAMCKQP